MHHLLPPATSALLWDGWYRFNSALKKAIPSSSINRDVASCRLGKPQNLTSIHIHKCRYAWFLVKYCQITRQCHNLIVATLLLVFLMFVPVVCFSCRSVSDYRFQFLHTKRKTKTNQPTWKISIKCPTRRSERARPLPSLFLATRDGNCAHGTPLLFLFYEINSFSIFAWPMWNFDFPIKAIYPRRKVFLVARDKGRIGLAPLLFLLHEIIQL